MMKQVMVRAWELAKRGAVKFGGSSKEYLASSLQIAWKEQKEMAQTTVYGRLQKDYEFNTNNAMGGALIQSRKKGTDDKFTVHWLNTSSKEESIVFIMSDGERIEVDVNELYKEVYAWDDDELCKHVKGYDLRTLDMLDEWKESINYEGQDTSYDNMELAYEKEVAAYTKTGLTADGRWVAQRAKWVSEDGYYQRFYFSEEPTYAQVEMAEFIEKIEYELKYGKERFPMIFKCDECGTETHWLDIKTDKGGTILDKMDSAINRYCGYC